MQVVSIDSKTISSGIVVVALLIGCGGPSSDAKSGQAVFEARCALCHGVMGEGNGQLAPAMKVKPANLTRSLLSKAQKEKIIRKGGAAVGRSDRMPSWEAELSDKEIAQIVEFLDSIKK